MPIIILNQGYLMSLFSRTTIHAPSSDIPYIASSPPRTQSTVCLVISIGHGSLSLNLLLHHNNFEDKYHFPPEVKTQNPYL